MIFFPYYLQHRYIVLCNCIKSIIIFSCQSSLKVQDALYTFDTICPLYQLINHQQLSCMSCTEMQNEQQISLSTNRARLPLEHNRHLEEKLVNESKVRNICLIVIIAIIISNYLQVRSLKANILNSQELIQEVIHLSRETKHNFMKEVEYRIGNMTELQSAIEKKITQIQEDSSSFKKSNQDQIVKFGSRLTRVQESMAKIRKDFDKHQDGALVTTQASEQKLANPQSLKKQNAIIEFVLNQLKEEFHQNKSKWFKSMMGHPTFKDDKTKTAFLSSLSNIRLKHDNALADAQIKQNEKAISKRLNQEYSLEKYDKQLPFCIVVATYNNAKNFRYQYNLQSILNLDYKKYRVVIIDDASTDGTYELLSSLISELHSKIAIHLIRNEIRMTAVPNIDKAIKEYCHSDDIVVLVDGDDELLVKDSLKVFNSVYQSRKVDVVYSNHLKVYWHQNDVYPGWSAAYAEAEIRENAYRDVPQKIAHLRSFKASLYLKIKEEDLKDKYGAWFQSTYDEVICLPILEMSCGRIAYVDEYFYLYNFGIGTNDLAIDGKKQKEIADYVKHKKKYSCMKQE